MTRQRALLLVLIISVIGVAFSGTLVYREFCNAQAAGCTALGASGTILGWPPCVYGLVMYLGLVAIASFGLQAKE
jgi:uncharacterized membrane protein